MGYKINNIYVGPTKVRPAGYEISYDFRGGSLAGLQAAGFDTIYTSGSYTIDSNGLGQTSSSNDRVTTVYTNSLDLTSATKITMESLGTWIQGSWSNDKDLRLCSSQSNDTSTNPTFQGAINLNSSSPGTYSYNGLIYSGSQVSGAGSKYAASGGDTTMTQVLDLANKTWTLTFTGANANSFTTTLSNAQITEIRACKAAVFRRGRGYSSFNGERLKTIYVKVEY